MLFQHLNDENTLKLLKYNKGLQNKIGLNLSNYKVFSGKYAIIDKNGIGREFNIYDDSLLFEGEYLNGKRKEYDYKILLFEGEYINGKKWNGKGYNYDNEVVYELKDGKGLVKEYDNGPLKFLGEYKDGERN